MSGQWQEENERAIFGSMASDFDADTEVFGETLVDSILAQLEPNVRLDDQVKKMVAEYAEEYVDKVLSMVCQLAKHRGSKAVTRADICYVLKHYFRD